jgi:thiamine kinase-like enzyme
VQIEALVRLVPALEGKDVAITALTGGITNRNYRVEAEGESYVLRVGGEGTELLGIRREVEHACSLAAARAGLAPEVVCFLPEHRLLVTRFVPGRVLTAEDMQRPRVMRRVVEALRRYHQTAWSGTPPWGRRAAGWPGSGTSWLAGAGSFSPFSTVRSYHALALEHGVTFPPGTDAALDLLGRTERLLQSDEPPCPCHNDLLPANLLDDGRSVWIVDWEYAGLGDRFFDLGNLAANGRFGEEQERALLEMYFGQLREGDLQRLQLMRLASDIRESFWGFLQAGISTLDFDFFGYGRDHLQRFLEGASALEGGLLPIAEAPA